MAAIQVFQLGDCVNIDGSGYAHVREYLQDNIYAVEIDGTDSIFHIETHRLRLMPSSTVTANATEQTTTSACGRFVDIGDDAVEDTIKAQENRNTRRKTQSDNKLFHKTQRPLNI